MNQTNYNQIIQQYIDQQIGILEKVFPTSELEDRTQFIANQVTENLVIPECKLVNNYTHTTKETDLDKLVNFLHNKKPILTEHGVMFKNQHEAVNLNAGLLKYLIDQRKVEKKLMFNCIGDAGKETDPEKKAALLKQAEVHDTKQKIYKIVANSLKLMAFILATVCLNSSNCWEFLLEDNQQLNLTYNIINKGVIKCLC